MFVSLVELVCGESRREEDPSVQQEVGPGGEPGGGVPGQEDDGGPNVPRPPGAVERLQLLHQLQVLILTGEKRGCVGLPT